jgi:hypothetical protein
MEMFGRTESQLSRIVTHMLNDLYDKFHHLLEFDERRLTVPMLEELAQTVAARGHRWTVALVSSMARCAEFVGQASVSANYSAVTSAHTASSFNRLSPQTASSFT